MSPVLLGQLAALVSHRLPEPRMITVPHVTLVTPYRAQHVRPSMNVVWRWTIVMAMQHAVTLLVVSAVPVTLAIMETASRVQKWHVLISMDWVLTHVFLTTSHAVKILLVVGFSVRAMPVIMDRL